MDKKEALKQIKSGELSLEDVDKKLQVDKEIVLAAVKQDGYALEYADKKLKADKEIVLAAVKENGFALEYVDKTLQTDKEIVLVAIQDSGATLEYADRTLQADKEIVLAAFKAKYGLRALRHADKKLKIDKEFILEIVKENGYALKYIDKKLKADMDVVLAAVKQEKKSLQYVDEKLQKELLKNAVVDLPEISLSGPELTYSDWTVKEKNINSIEKVKNIISDALNDNYDDTTSHLVLGTDICPPSLDDKYISIENSWDEDEEDPIDIKIIDKGTLIKKPKKGEFIFVFYYYYDHSTYMVNINAYTTDTEFEIKIFQDEAVVVKTDYPNFDLTAEDASGGGDYMLKILCSDGQSFEGGVYGKEDLIDKFSQYLIDKGVIKK